MNENKKHNPYNIFFFVLISIFIIVFFPTIKSLIYAWKGSDDYSHGFFIVPISIYLIWMKKYQIEELQFQPNILGLFFMIFSSLCYIISQYAGILTLAPIAMVCVVISSIIYLFGFNMLRLLIFPLFFLFLMIPIPSQIYSEITIPLQLIVTKASVEFGRFISIPILREGNVIQMADTTLQVVNACSGLRSIISLFTLCTIFGYLSLANNISRVLLCLSSILVAITINIVRVSMMIVFQHFYQIDLTHGTAHTLVGIGLFFLALTIVYAFQSLLIYGENKIAVH